MSRRMMTAETPKPAPAISRKVRPRRPALRIATRIAMTNSKSSDSVIQGALKNADSRYEAVSRTSRNPYLGNRLGVRSRAAAARARLPAWPRRSSRPRRGRCWPAGEVPGPARLELPDHTARGQQRPDDERVEDDHHDRPQRRVRQEHEVTDRADH